MENIIAQITSLPFLLLVLVYFTLTLVVLTSVLYVYSKSTPILLKIGLRILLLSGKVKSLIQRYLLRKPTTRYNMQELQSFVPLTLSDLSPESNPALHLSKKEKQSFQKKQRKTQKRGKDGRFMKG